MSSIIGLLFGSKYYQSNIGGVFLDATLTEDHEYTSRVTNFPVENGNVISDHIINDPVRLSITGIVSDSPIRFLSVFNRSSDAFNRLVRIHDLKERITVVTGIKIYQNMVMTSLSVPRDTNTGQSLTFNIELQQLLLDTTSQINIYGNDPFSRSDNRINRDQVADSEKYPFIKADPSLSLKDQATSETNLGIQNLQPISPQLLPNINDSFPVIRGFI